jgi:hypothetical protein
MKTYFLFFSFLGLMFIHCKDKPTTQEATLSRGILVGGDEDPHGCKASAGYIYCLAKQGCIRLWEDGYRFTAVTVEESAASGTSDVFIVLADDALQAEIFWPGDQRPTLLPRVSHLDKSNGYEVMFSSSEENVSIVKNEQGWFILFENSPIYFSEAASQIQMPKF